MSNLLTLYTAASIRHLHAVRLFHAALRDAVPGVQILDWTEQSTPPDGLTPAKRREWFDTEQSGGQVFAFCREACCQADLVIYLGASGQDAGVEVGMAHAAGVPVLGIRGPLESPGLMLHGAVSLWVDDVFEAVDAVASMTLCGTSEACPHDCPLCRYADICPTVVGQE